jgi:hypothetical protein
MAGPSELILARRTDLVPEDKKDPDLPKGTFSYSQYALYQKCPKAYEFSYVKNIKNPPSGLSFKGQIVHKGAEAAHRAKQAQSPLELEAGKAIVADEFERGKEEVLEWEEGEDEGKAKDLTVRTYQTYHLKALPKVQPEAVEQPFVLYLDSVPVVGYIDLIDRVGGSVHDGVEDLGLPVVADLKMSRQSWSQADLDKDPQFTLYSKVTGIPTVRVDNLVTLKNGPEFKQQTATRDRRHHLVVLEHIAETVDLVKKGIFPKTQIDSWACSEKWCGYWKMCRGRKL